MAEKTVAQKARVKPGARIALVASRVSSSPAFRLGRARQGAFVPRWQGTSAALAVSKWQSRDRLPEGGPA